MNIYILSFINSTLKGLKYVEKSIKAYFRCHDVYSFFIHQHLPNIRLYFGVDIKSYMKIKNEQGNSARFIKELGFDK